jgi:hypothetical protein
MTRYSGVYAWAQQIVEVGSEAGSRDCPLDYSKEQILSGSISVSSRNDFGGLGLNGPLLRLLLR